MYYGIDKYLSTIIIDRYAKETRDVCKNNVLCASCKMNQNTLKLHRYKLFTNYFQNILLFFIVIDHILEMLDK